VVAIFVVMWRETIPSMRRHLAIAVPTRSALIAAIAGALSGEYYYGGVTVLLLLAIFAFVGSEAINNSGC